MGNTTNPNSISRKEWLKQSGVVVSGLLLNNLFLNISEITKPPKTILMVSGWQDINIGDIAHTPGLLNVFETFLPDSRIILWKRSFSSEVEELLKRNFPKVRIIHGNVNADSSVDSEDVKAAFAEADLMIHGSGPSVVGKTNLEAWVKVTGKPFGIFGTTIQTIDKSLAELLKKALFIYTRETASLKVLADSGIKAKSQFFVPDATFFLSLKNDEKAATFLAEKNLEEKKFICVIPRLRRTPYYKVNPASYTPEQVKAIDDLNNSKKEIDHAKLREAIITWVRKTGNKVLVCPEMTYQVDIMDELLIDPLPEDVKPFVQKRGYWFPDEAASVYAKAFAVLSFECHSPIIALRNGTPAFYLRQPEDTIKGQMYYDLGLKDWVFEIEQVTGRKISDQLIKIYSDPESASKTVKNLNKSTEDLYRAAVKVLIKM
jgi:polysaccharide pyruvyl transferase WcaK-like protein